MDKLSRNQADDIGKDRL